MHLKPIVLTRAGDTTAKTITLPVSGLIGGPAFQDDPNLIAGRDQTISDLTVGGTYDIYYIHSTDGETYSSTIFSGTQFTVVNSPTGEPSGQPSGEPSGEPSAVPTSPTGEPTGEPSGEPTAMVFTRHPTPSPTSEPTSEPTSQPSSTFAPTGSIKYTTVTGNVTIDRGATDFCKDTSMKLYLTFDKKILEGQSLYLDMPGFTNGPCSSPLNGFDFQVSAHSNSSKVRLFWLEGNYTNMFRDSKLRIIMEDHTMDRIQVHQHSGFMEIDIDRANGLKFSCMTTRDFPMQIRQLQSPNLFSAVGTVRFESFTQTKCFLYHSSLGFFPPQPQTQLQLNLTMRMAMDFRYGDNVTLNLPGFTRSASFIVDPTDSTKLTWGRVTGTSGWLKNVTGGMLKTSGPARSHFGTDWSIGKWVSSHMYKQWYADWTEGVFNGSSAFIYSDSKVTFSINPNSGPNPFTVKQGGSEQDDEDTFIKAGDMFSIVIDNINKLSTYCGRPFNYSDFKVSVSSSYSSMDIDLETVQHSPMIGSGCPFGKSPYNKQEMCSGRGTCNFCTGQCECYEGFGSTADRLSVEVDNFNPACSDHICPFGTSFGILPGATGFRIAIIIKLLIALSLHIAFIFLMWQLTLTATLILSARRLEFVIAKEACVNVLMDILEQHAKGEHASMTVLGEV